ncbi:MAG: amidase [Dongiaceae bacterium]
MSGTARRSTPTAPSPRRWRAKPRRRPTPRSPRAATTGPAGHPGLGQGPLRHGRAARLRRHAAAAAGALEADGPVVARLRGQRAVVTGKSHTVEFALGGLGTNRHWGAPWNPWDAAHHRVPGGSSSGRRHRQRRSSALVALGSDTTGSVRMPASWTGTVGLMVSHGRWPVEGIVPVAPVLDAPGLLTRTVADQCRPSWRSTARRSWPPRTRSTSAAASCAAVRLGVAESFFWSGCSPGVAGGVRAALAELERAGAVLVDLAMPEPQPVYEMFQKGHLSTAAVYGMIEGEFADLWETLDPNVRLRLEQHGANLSAHEYVARLRRIEELDARRRRAARQRSTRWCCRPSR